MILAPYVPTSINTIKRMLEIANITLNDVIFDIGSGDGRIVLMAVRTFKAKSAIGIELREDLVHETRKLICKQGLEHQITIIHGDAFTVDISNADVVTLYLTSRGVELLRPKLEKEFKPGTRIVSLSYPIKPWTPVKTDGFWFKIYLYQR